MVAGPQSGTSNSAGWGISAALFYMAGLVSFGTMSSMASGRPLAGDDRTHLVALLPFAALGIALGHLLNVDSIGPAMGGLTALLALVGGTWFPVTRGFLHTVGQCLPSYWLAQAGHFGTGDAAWSLTGWLVMAAWTVALTALAGYAYRRDTRPRLSRGAMCLGVLGLLGSLLDLGSALHHEGAHRAGKAGDDRDGVDLHRDIEHASGA